LSPLVMYFNHKGRVKLKLGVAKGKKVADKRETEALLREIGHPIAVAGRYGPRTALIGPELYPFWIFGVKALLAIAAFATVIPAGVVLVTGQGGGHVISGAVKDFIDMALGLLGFAVIVGAAIERGWIKLGDFSNWKVSDLPRLPENKGWPDSKAGSSRAASTACSSWSPPVCSSLGGPACCHSPPDGRTGTTAWRSASVRSFRPCMGRSWPWP